VGHRSEGIGVAQSVAPTAPGGEAGAVAAAQLGGGGSSAWPRWLAGGSSGRRVGGCDAWAGTSGNCGRDQACVWVIFT
jgi:hypothetical protein